MPFWYTDPAEEGERAPTPVFISEPQPDVATTVVVHGTALQQTFALRLVRENGGVYRAYDGNSELSILGLGSNGLKLSRCGQEIEFVPKFAVDKAVLTVCIDDEDVRQHLALTSNRCNALAAQLDQEKRMVVALEANMQDIVKSKPVMQVKNASVETDNDDDEPKDTEIQIYRRPRWFWFGFLAGAGATLSMRLFAFDPAFFR